MSLATFIEVMPKVELHVHLEGAIGPATLLQLARRYGIALPADTVEGLRSWYTFTGFEHFIHVYSLISACIRTPDDIELIAREFLAGQAAQNVRYSEVTYTAYAHFVTKGISFDDQLAALNRARRWAGAEFGVAAGWVIDIPRTASAEEGLWTANAAIGGMSDGVVAVGLGGPEVGNPPERFVEAFARARAAGLPGVPHAGETAGPESIWGALRSLGAVRIGHGVRCLDDPVLVTELRARQIPLEVSPTSNVCLKVASSIAGHPLPRLLAEGLYVTINSDDPALFNTTLTNEYQAITATFGLNTRDIEKLVLNGVQASLLPAAERDAMSAGMAAQFKTLGRQQLGE
jgi:aminodeoxyfutalosine deaminase